MNSLVFSFSAAGCTALSSLFFRKNTDHSKNASGYLIIFYLFSFLLSFVIYPDIWNVEINYVILTIGILVGILNSTLMVLTSRALKEGPPGLTYAFQNASAVFPGIILFVILGSNFGFSCSFLQLVGMGLVLLGLFLGAKKESSDQQTSTTTQSKTSSTWLKYALACFVVQILALTIIQARCIFFDSSAVSGVLAKLSFSEAQDVWFMPGLFGASLLSQIILFLKEKKGFQKSEVLYGSLGGVANFASTSLLLLATKFATPLEKGILFPCFAVASMILCNLWANRLYGEKFNFKTNALCSFGIFMAAAS
jgi:hypothetical protein